MTSAEALLLGIVQGITEFLPVSSSGHLMLFQALFGMDNLRGLLLFDLVCHLGTLFSIFVYFFDKIRSLLTTDRHTLLLLVIGTSPLFLAVLALPYIEKAFNTPLFLGVGFFLSGIILLLSDRFGADIPTKKLKQEECKDSFLIGCAQAVAVVPAISRSGSTISTARLLGFSRQNAFNFSFLLAIPAILGGISLELLHIFMRPEKIALAQVFLLQYFLGFIFSFATGLAALRVLVRFVLSDALKYFAWYCFAVSIFCTLYFVIL